MLNFHVLLPIRVGIFLHAYNHLTVILYILQYFGKWCLKNLVYIFLTEYCTILLSWKKPWNMTKELKIKNSKVIAICFKLKYLPEGQKLLGNWHNSWLTKIENCFVDLIINSFSYSSLANNRHIQRFYWCCIAFFNEIFVVNLFSYTIIKSMPFWLRWTPLGQCPSCFVSIR